MYTFIHSVPKAPKEWNLRSQWLSLLNYKPSFEGLVMDQSTEEVYYVGHLVLYLGRIPTKEFLGAT